MTEANTPVPREALHPYAAGHRAIKAHLPVTSVLRCSETARAELGGEAALESLPVQE